MEDRDYDEFSSLIKGLFEEHIRFDAQDVSSWTSMQSLIVVNAIDEHYDTLISNEELKKTKSLNELFEVLSNKES